MAFTKFGHQHTVRARFGTPLKHWSHLQRVAFLDFSVNEFTTSSDSNNSRIHSNFAQHISSSSWLAAIFLQDEVTYDIMLTIQQCC